MERILLCSLNSLALLVLLGMFSDIRHSSSHRCRLLKNVIVHCALFSLAELAYDLTYAKPELTPFQHMANILYYIELVMIPCVWYFFISEINVSKKARLTPTDLLLYIPVMIIVVLSCISPFTGIVYSIDENGLFIRGPVADFITFISSIYYIVAVSRAVVLAYRETDRDMRSNYLFMDAFCAMPMICAALQLYTGAGGILSAGEAVALFYIYTRFKNHQISLDPLTGLNNRLELTHYVTQRTSVATCAFNNSWIVMADIDKFKKINDTFGHLEGDFALSVVGQILKDAADRFNCFVARYGGDEFVIIFDGEEHQARMLCDYIDRRIADNEECSRKYKLTLSMGIARIPDFCQDDIVTLMHQADRNMYNVKQSKTLLQF